MCPLTESEDGLQSMLSVIDDTLNWLQTAVVTGETT